MAKQQKKTWRAVSYAAGRGRAVVRHWVLGPNGERVGHYPTREDAEREAAAQNAAPAASSN